ncbi:hypothetical protein B1218_07110, partial [Pseudomonas ogarae]
MGRGRGEAGGGLGEVVARGEHGVGGWGVGHGREGQRGGLGHLRGQADGVRGSGLDGRVEVLGADRCT